jgi:hypothetical protein
MRTFVQRNKGMKTHRVAALTFSVPERIVLCVRTWRRKNKMQERKEITDENHETLQCS